MVFKGELLLVHRYLVNRQRTGLPEVFGNAIPDNAPEPSESRQTKVQVLNEHERYYKEDTKAGGTGRIFDIFVHEHGPDGEARDRRVPF